MCSASAPTERGRYLVELQPTARLQPATAPIAPSGVWKVRLENLLLEPGEAVQAWIQRDDTAYGYPIRGRQSYFDQPCYVRFDAQGREIEEDNHPAQAMSPCHVKRASLINSLATSSGKNIAIGAGTIVAAPIVAGGYLRKELSIARYSAGEPITPPAGGTLPPNLHKPDATLVSDDSKVHAGVLAAGSRSGSQVAINGTSVAAPTLARWVADNYNLRHRQPRRSRRRLCQGAGGRGGASRVETAIADGTRGMWPDAARQTRISARQMRNTVIADAPKSASVRNRDVRSRFISPGRAKLDKHPVRLRLTH